MNKTLLVWLVLFACTIWYFISIQSSLPDTVATHFDLSGNPNDFMTKAGNFWFFILTLGISNSILLALYKWFNLLPPSAISTVLEINS